MDKSFVSRALLALSLTAGATFALAAAVQAQDVKVPESPADHLALAKMYQEKAAGYRKDAEYHRQMLEAYKKSVPSAPKTGPNPWVVKMQKHCQMLIKDAEKLATDAEKSAEYHTLRAKELEGK